MLDLAGLPETLALAQHHGIPTRLLDWTRNPITAAFFAVEGLRKPIEGESLVVWGLHKRHSKDLVVEGVAYPNSPPQVPRFDPMLKIVRPSTRDNPFLIAQAGLFTTISRSGIYFMKSGGKRPSLEAFVTEANPPTIVLRKIVLSQQHAPDLIEILRRERVSHAALMPTMDNVAKDIRTKWGQ